MKPLFRSFLVNTASLWIVTQLIPALLVTDGLLGLLKGGAAFMIANLVLVPIIKVLLLPLNLLTVGLFAWLANVIALFLLIRAIPTFKLLPYHFPGATFGGITLSPMELSTFQTAILVSFLLGFLVHFLRWLIH